MTQVYIASDKYVCADTHGNQQLITYAAENVGLDTSLCQHDSSVDADSSSYQDKFKTEITKLLNAKCAILDLTNPSHDVGFYAGYLFADRPKLPVLGLTPRHIGSIAGCSAERHIMRESRMLSSCPQIQLNEYNPDRPHELQQIISDWLVTTKVHVPRPNGPVVLMVGAPGTGKTTQAKLLSAKLGIPVIDVFNPKYIIAERLSRHDCQQGYILDSNPPTEEHFNNLRELGIKINLIIYLCADYETCISRQLVKDGIATGYTREIAIQCMDNFMAGFQSLKKSGHEDNKTPTELDKWFPSTRIAKVFTAAQDFPPKRVLESVFKQCNLPFPVNCTESEWQLAEQKARIHFSINGAQQGLVMRYAKQSGLPCKVYPINTYTQQGCSQPADPDYTNIYSNLYYSSLEVARGDRNKAIANGVLTDNDIQSYLGFLEQLAIIPLDERENKPISVDITESMWTQSVFFTSDGKKDGCETRDYSVGGWTNWSRLPSEAREQIVNFNSLKRVEYNIYKITHSMDIPKLSSSRDTIDEWLSKLAKITNFGGIFVFETPTTWNIQTNQLWNRTYEDCKAESQLQQANIQCPFKISAINTSIKLVHAMWCN